MQIQYKTILNPYNSATYKLLPSIYCCSKLKEEIDNTIEFSPEGSINLTIYDAETDYDGGLTKNYTNINFCPFCGEKILYKETQRKKIVVKNEIRTYTRLEPKYEEVDAD